ncbi:hypothetical protein M8J77_019100 [Diaphorina citri]|nr:hypothetical protein M8J77_019100 [Diaphorina citri]
MRSYLATLEKSLTGILMMKEMANSAEDVANDFDIVNRIVKNEFDNYKFGHAFSTSLAMPRDELAGFRSEATEFS